MKIVFKEAIKATSFTTTNNNYNLNKKKKKIVLFSFSILLYLGKRIFQNVVKIKIRRNERRKQKWFTIKIER